MRNQAPLGGIKYFSNFPSESIRYGVENSKSLPSVGTRPVLNTQVSVNVWRRIKISSRSPKRQVCLRPRCGFSPTVWGLGEKRTGFVHNGSTGKVTCKNPGRGNVAPKWRFPLDIFFCLPHESDYAVNVSNHLTGR